MSSPSLNERAWEVLENYIRDAWQLGWVVTHSTAGTVLVDAGCQVVGSALGGLAMAEIGMSGLGRVTYRLGNVLGISWPLVEVITSHPVEACLLSQAAHWPVEINGNRAMGSGPACLLRQDDIIGKKFDWVEASHKAVLIVEAPSLPDVATCEMLAAACRVEPDSLAVVVAPTSSLAGSAQIAARSIETALHRLFQLGFLVQNIVDCSGICPLAVPTGENLTALGRTNDLMMFASQVWLAVKDMSGEELAGWVKKVPACSTPQFGVSFLDALKQAGGFYNLDPGLFAPAEITITSLQDGRVCRAGEIFRPGLLSALGMEG